MIDVPALQRFEIWISDPRGSRLAAVDQVVRFVNARTVNWTGGFSIGLPGSFNQALLTPDNWIEFWYAPKNGPLRLDFLGMIRRVEMVDDGDGLESTVVSGPDQLGLLARRIVAYKAGSSQADQADFADDICKAIVRQNFGSDATDSDRNLASYGLSVAADLSDGPSITKAFAYRNCLEALQEVAETARQAGTEVFFDLVPGFDSVGRVALTFETFTGQRCADRTADGDNPVWFGKQSGNLGAASLDYDWSNEISVAYCGGQGEGSERALEEVEDTTRTRSVWGRIERFTDGRNLTTSAGLQAKAQQLLAEQRARLRFSADLLDSEQAVYGRDWFFGDRVSVDFRGLQFDGMIRSREMALDGSGRVTITARLEVDR